MKKQIRQILVTAVLAAAGLALLLVAESRAFLKFHLPSPGLWELAFIVVGWQLIVAPPIFLAAGVARRSAYRPISVTGGVLFLLSTLGIAALNGFFAWVMVSWGLATNWTFTK